MRNEYLSAANRIGDRIVNNAIWCEDACTWEIAMKTEKESKSPRYAPSNIYEGTAGIVIFLLQLYKINPAVKIKHVIEGALKYTFKESSEISNNFSFYTGKVGIAYVSALAGMVLFDNTYTEYSNNVVDTLLSAKKHDRYLDVISGEAGSIPILLILSKLLTNNSAFQIAIDLGENLINLAIKEPNGWSWRFSHSFCTRNLCGYGHGSSGFGHAFMELYNITGSSDYLYAAEQSFLYERQFYNIKRKNWVNFLNHKLMAFYYLDKVGELKEILRQDKLERFEPNYSIKWCHGAPGIGLARIRAYQTLGIELYKKEAEDSISCTMEWLDNSWGANYSLCHGIFGNSETILNYSIVSNSKELRSYVEEIALKGIEFYNRDNIQWPCGTGDSRPDPSFMLGEAGIGYYLLRLYDDRIPSLLCPTVDTLWPIRINSTLGFNRIQNEYIRIYFKNIIEIIEAHEAKSINEVFDFRFTIGDNISDVKKAYVYISEYILKQPDELLVWMNDAFLPEKSKYDMTLAITDFTEEMNYQLIQEPVDSIVWETTLLYLSPFVEVIEQKYIWNNKTTKFNKRLLGDCYCLLYKANNSINIEPIEVFPYLLLTYCRKEINYTDLVESIISVFDILNEENIVLLKDKIIAQVREFYINGIIKIKNSAFV